MSTVYISGPISLHGTVTLEQRQKYVDRFYKAEARLSELGHTLIVNPAGRSQIEGKSWQAYMKEAITELLACDSILMLPEWASSEGARLELHIARALKMTVLHADEVNLYFDEYP